MLEASPFDLLRANFTDLIVIFDVDDKAEREREREERVVNDDETSNPFIDEETKSNPNILGTALTRN